MNTNIKIFKIDGAIVMTDMKIENAENPEKAVFHIPKMNYEYKIGAEIDGFPMASKDGEHFVIAVSYDIGGKHFLNILKKEV